MGQHQLRPRGRGDAPAAGDGRGRHRQRRRAHAAVLGAESAGPPGQHGLGSSSRNRAAQVLPPDVARDFSRIMRSVVKDGSGSQADVPGYRVAGKTGTAQIPEGGRYTDKDIASFVAFAPADAPELAGIVMLYDVKVYPTFGGIHAAPVMGRVLEAALAYLGVPGNRRRGKERSRNGAGSQRPQLAPAPGGGGACRRPASRPERKGKGVYVVDQTPKPGARRRPGQEVFLSFFDVPPLWEGTVTVPDVIGHVGGRGRSVAGRRVLAAGDGRGRGTAAGHEDPGARYGCVRPGDTPVTCRCSTADPWKKLGHREKGARQGKCCSRRTGRFGGRAIGRAGWSVLPDAFTEGRGTAVTPVVSGISYDSRRVKPGDLFVCWRGQRHDGHQFAREAVRRGGGGARGGKAPAGHRRCPKSSSTDARVAMAYAAAQLLRLAVPPPAAHRRDGNEREDDDDPPHQGGAGGRGSPGGPRGHDPVRRGRAGAGGPAHNAGIRGPAGAAGPHGRGRHHPLRHGSVLPRRRAASASRRCHFAVGRVYEH